MAPVARGHTHPAVVLSFNHTFTILDNPLRVYTPQLILMPYTVELNNKNPADPFGRLSTDQRGVTRAAFAYE